MRHDNVLRKLESMECSADFHHLNFEEMIHAHLHESDQSIKVLWSRDFFVSGDEVSYLDLCDRSRGPRSNCNLSTSALEFTHHGRSLSDTGFFISGPPLCGLCRFLGVSMLDELVSRLISYVGGSLLVVTAVKTGDAVDAAVEAGADMVSHGGSLMRMPFTSWPPLSELAGMISMGDVLGLIGAGAVLYRLWLDIRKSRGERNDNP